MGVVIVVVEIPKSINEVVLQLLMELAILAALEA